MTAASPAQTRRLISQLGAKLGGKTRGPDSGAGRRVPRRHSYEENDARAQPWRKVGDGSIAQGIAHREAKVEAAVDLRRQLWAEFPAAEVRRRRQERAAASAELAHLLTLAPAEVPIGRPATLRILIAQLDEWLGQADNRLRRIDIDVLRALLSFWDFTTGKLIPRHDTIAARAGVHENSVIGSLKRLKIHGLVDWIRRTTRTGNEGEFGPQLEQTSNAYFFDHRRKMAARTWQTYWKRLCAKLRRFGGPRPSMAPGAPKLALVTAEAPLTPVQAALASLGASIDNATT